MPLLNVIFKLRQLFPEESEGEQGKVEGKGERREGERAHGF